MTNEDAIIIIGNLPIAPDECYSITEYQEAKTLAIKALEQQPCEDCISREEAIRTLTEKKEEFKMNSGFTRHGVDCAIETIKELPSVKPVTQWHKAEIRPLTDEEKEVYGEEYTYIYDCKMPDEGQEVLVKTKWGIEKTTYHTDYGCYFEDYEDEDDVVAWTELPKWEGKE